MSNPSAAAAPAAPATRVGLAAFLGTTIEWYDFYIYSTASALIFSRAFFPASTDPVTALLGSFAAYGVGFFARPLGAVLAGHFGDRVGRKRVLVFSLMLMGVATVLTGLLPTYAQAGLWATGLLVVLRLLQGVATGAEWGGASLLSVEHARPRSRGLLGSFTQVGSAAGMLLASATFLGVRSALTEADFAAWGWRLPFLFSVVLVAVGIFVRLRIEEPAPFQAAKAEGRIRRLPVADVFRHHRRALFVTIGLRLVQPAMYAIVTTYAISYLNLKRGGGASFALSAVIVGSACAVLVTPLWAALSDRIGRRRPAIWAVVGIGLFVWPFFWFLEHGDLRWLPLVFAIELAVFDAAIYAPGAAWFAEQFPVEVRYSGISLGYQIGTLLSGGLTPFVATWLFAAGDGAPWLICAYISALAVLSLLAVFAAVDPARQLGRRTDPVAASDAALADPR
ncbi:MFS transporter [Chitinasiproducens palmae]|uniref:Major Facilitator Superfamily protein n=1 Tax=Chitinasiproducens palmae TaxID=1770053 RepID=A0A1H2PPT7_9BURK|nr:MFS transporter [Chitinasiproducens palmae]SDV48793.1 Major Facilitator Superfamily protein [Chitinasiproducens palmae]